MKKLFLILFLSFSCFLFGSNDNQIDDYQVSIKKKEIKKPYPNKLNKQNYSFVSWIFETDPTHCKNALAAMKILRNKHSHQKQGTEYKLLYVNNQDDIIYTVYSDGLSSSYLPERIVRLVNKNGQFYSLSIESEHRRFSDHEVAKAVELLLNENPLKLNRLT